MKSFYKKISLVIQLCSSWWFTSIEIISRKFDGSFSVSLTTYSGIWYLYSSILSYSKGVGQGSICSHTNFQESIFVANIIFPHNYTIVSGYNCIVSHCYWIFACSLCLVTHCYCSFSHSFCFKSHCYRVCSCSCSIFSHCYGWASRRNCPVSHGRRKISECLCLTSHCQRHYSAGNVLCAYCYRPSIICYGSKS